MRIVVFEFNLMACYGIGVAVEDDEAGRCSSLVYTTNEPLLRLVTIDMVSVDTWALALADISHSLKIVAQTRGYSVILFNRGSVVVRATTRQGGVILAARGWPRFVAGGERRGVKNRGRSGGGGIGGSRIIYRGRSDSGRSYEGEKGGGEELGL